MSTFAFSQSTYACSYRVKVRCLDAHCLFRLNLTSTAPQKEKQLRFISSFDSVQKNNYLVSSEVAPGLVEYFYIPVDPKLTRNMAVVLEKLQGDAYLILSLTGSQVEERGASKWRIPSLSERHNFAISFAMSADVDETITVCQDMIEARCPDKDFCVLVIGVFSNELDRKSRFNLRVLDGDRMLESGRSVHGILDNLNKDNYFWFASNP